MKKIRLVFLLCLLCVSMVACFQSEQAKQADAAILAIGEVSLEKDCVDAILAADELVRKLSENDYNSLKNIETLEEARKTYSGMLLTAVNTIRDKADALDLTALTLDDKDMVAALKNEYTSAPAIVKDVLEGKRYMDSNGYLVDPPSSSNSAGGGTAAAPSAGDAAMPSDGSSASGSGLKLKLLNADYKSGTPVHDNCLSEIESLARITTARPLQKIKNAERVLELRTDNGSTVDAMIAELSDLVNANSIGALAPYMPSFINQIKNEYNALDPDMKTIVTKYGDYEKLNDEFAVLKAEITKVESAINAIGTVTLGSESKITAAQNAFNKASKDIQNAVSNADVLKKAVQRMDSLNAAKKNAEEQIRAIGTSISLESKWAIAAAEKAINAVGKDNVSYISNYSTFTSCKQVYDNLIATTGKASLDKLSKTYDKFENLTTYSSPVMPYYSDTRCYVFPYIEQTSYLSLRMEYHYTGTSWLFYDGISIYIDGETTGFYVGYNGNNWDHAGYYVWEWTNNTVSDSEYKMLLKMAKSKEAVVRFEGEHYNYDMTVSASDKQAILDVLYAYEYLKTQEKK